MITVFVDTSAVLALLVANDAAHDRARKGLDRLRSQRARLLTSSYVLAEVYAIVGRRLGLTWVREVRDAWEPLVQIVWVDRQWHDQALDRLLRGNSRDLSLVDACSFAIMEERGITHAFAFDRHFVSAGFALVQ